MRARCSAGRDSPSVVPIRSRENGLTDGRGAAEGLNEGPLADQKASDKPKPVNLIRASDPQTEIKL